MAFTESASSLAEPGSLPRVVVEGLMHRSELVSLELHEASVHGLRTVALTVFCGALLLLAGFALTFAIAAGVWNRPDRGMILVLLAIAYLVVSGVVGFAARRRLSTWEPMSESIKQFREDCTLLRETLTHPGR